MKNSCPSCYGDKFGKVIYHGAARFYAPKEYDEYACPNCEYRERRDKAV